MAGSTHSLDHLDLDEYVAYISKMRNLEYPMLEGQLYLDHAGMTPYSKSLLDRFNAEMMSSLLGNPHSSSPSSLRSTQVVETVRHQLLSFFNADPAEFDLIFTAKTTAAVKLIMEAFRGLDHGFDYGYHVDSHTSIIGLRESTDSHQCLVGDEDVRSWLGDCRSGSRTRLLAIPAQSNMDGSRLLRKWCGHARETGTNTYTLLDAASFVSTSPLDLSIADEMPDLVVLSLYKIFGFPDLGALLVRKERAPLFEKRSYFGGGTVDMVVCIKEQWHVQKTGPLHRRLEDGTLPIHSILALKSALATHTELFGSLERISEHTADLARRLYDGLNTLRHGNGTNVCTMYRSADSAYHDRTTQGPIVAFNMKDSHGEWISNAEVEKVTGVNNIHLRTGGVCNPGGIAQTLKLSSWELRSNFSAGFRCGEDNDIMNGKPTGVIRLSLGAMSTRDDVTRFLGFIQEFFVESCLPSRYSSAPETIPSSNSFYIESLTIYPIKSCKGWSIPCDRIWEVRPEGLLWDREWCIVHAGNGKALSQKQYPSMALITPILDLNSGHLKVTAPGVAEAIQIPLSKDPAQFVTKPFPPSTCNTNVCGDSIQTRIYHSKAILDFFSTAIGVPCTLARFPTSATTGSPNSYRRSKPHLSITTTTTATDQPHPPPPPILLSNESPILTISRSSLNRLNEQIKGQGGKAAHPSVFRANIVLAESPFSRPGCEQPWAEDHWRTMSVVTPTRRVVLDFLGACRRCQMVCIDQVSAEKNPEPFSTLARTRRTKGKVYFGVHTALAQKMDKGFNAIKVGDVVETTP